MHLLNKNRGYEIRSSGFKEKVEVVKMLGMKGRHNEVWVLSDRGRLEEEGSFPRKLGTLKRGRFLLFLVLTFYGKEFH